MNDLFKDLSTPVKQTNVTPTESIKGRYTSILNVVQAYVNYLSTTGNTKLACEKEVMPVVDAIIEKYELGGKFIDDVKMHILNTYQFNHAKVMKVFRENEDVKGSVDLTISEFNKNGIADLFTGSFKNLIKSF